MTVDTDVAELIRLLRLRGTDLTTVEAKSSAGGLSKSLRETLSAFSNDRGGTVVLGLDERAGFAPSSSFDPGRIRDDLAAMCADMLIPPVRAEIEIVDVDGGQVVVAEVPELDPTYKPCYVAAKGEYAGSYTRGGDGDRRMTEYEVALLHANRGQPREDLTPVPEAGPGALDGDSVRRLLDRVRQREASAFGGVDDRTCLRRLGVLVESDDGRLVPSLCGLITLATYPQQFFPQLNITFVVIPATSKDAVPAGQPRFLDNRAFNGPVTVMIESAVTAVIRNMSIRGTVHGVGREDAYDYPVEAVREAITNAVMHRDYSPYARGTQVQVEMYQDRLQVRSPGGLFGTVTADDLGQEGVSSSRNAHLARLLEEVVLPGTDRVVCENRGTGIPTMIQLLRRVGMTPPRFDSTISRFSVTFPKHTLLDAETHRWIATLGQQGLTDAQCMAMALMREGRTVTNASLRQLGLERAEATTALADLVARGIAIRQGGRRYASYVLDAAPRSVQLTLDSDNSTRTQRTDRVNQVLALFDAGRALTAREVSEATGLQLAMATRYLNRLIDQGRIEPTAPARSRHRAYRRVRQ